MSWFLYGEQKKTCRKGLRLRVRHLPQPILKQFEKLMRRGEYIDYVLVHEVRRGKKDEPRKALLQCWSHAPIKDPHGKRFTVTYVLADEDPKWVCEGDGLRKFKGHND